MGNIRGLKNRPCPNCRALAPHRTIYARATVEGTRKWLPLFWACIKCHSLNHVVVQVYSLTHPPSNLLSASVGVLIRALERGPLDCNQLLANLRRNKTPGTSHVFKSEVSMAVEYLKASGVVTESPRDATDRAFEALRGKRLGPCPRDAQRALVSLYAQRKSPSYGTRFIPAGVFCLGCGYHHIDW